MSVKLVAVILALAISAAYASPATSAQRSNYIEQENSCRQVCGLCDCDGFYCEDECICECNLEEDENLQCIADMKKECDANGLEYELIMQESAKERFLRQVKGNAADLNKHLVVLKQKRQSASTTTEPTVGAAAPSSNSSDPNVAAPAPKVNDNDNNVVGMPLTALVTSLNGKAAIAGLNQKSAMSDLRTSKLLIMLQERWANRKSERTPITLPTIVFTTPAPTTTTKKFTWKPFPTLPPVNAPIVQPSFLFNH